MPWWSSRSADADAARAAAGIAPWTLLTGVQERAAWELAVAPPDALVQSMTDAHIHMETDAGAVNRAKSALQALPSELIATLQLDAALAAATRRLTTRRRRPPCSR